MGVKGLDRMDATVLGIVGSNFLVKMESCDRVVRVMPLINDGVIMFLEDCDGGVVAEQVSKRMKPEILLSNQDVSMASVRRLR